MGRKGLESALRLSPQQGRAAGPGDGDLAVAADDIAGRRRSSGRSCGRLIWKGRRAWGTEWERGLQRLVRLNKAGLAVIVVLHFGLGWVGEARLVTVGDLGDQLPRPSLMHLPVGLNGPLPSALELNLHEPSFRSSTGHGSSKK